MYIECEQPYSFDCAIAKMHYLVVNGINTPVAKLLLPKPTVLCRSEIILSSNVLVVIFCCCILYMKFLSIKGLLSKDLLRGDKVLIFVPFDSLSELLSLLELSSLPDERSTANDDGCH